MSDLTQAAVAARTLRTVDGVVLNAITPILDVPSMGRCVRLDFVTVSSRFPGLAGAIRAACEAMLTFLTPERVWNHLAAIRSLLRSVDGGATLTRIDTVHFTAFQAALPPHARYRASKVRDALLAWALTDVPGIDPLLVDLLPSFICPAPVPAKAVRILSAERGALTPGEEARLCQALHGARRREEISAESYLICLMIIGLHCRPIQIAVMKLCDLRLIGPNPGVRVTRVKQGVGIRPRTSFRERELTPLLAVLLGEQVRSTAAWSAARGIDRDAAPLFPARRVRRVRPELPHMLGHMTAQAVGERVTLTIDRLRIPADGREGDLHVFSQRLRRTCATRAAADGHPLSVIAELLDQTAEQTSAIYVQTTEGTVGQIDAAVGDLMSGWAQGFTDDALGDPEP